MQTLPKTNHSPPWTVDRKQRAAVIIDLAKRRRKRAASHVHVPEAPTNLSGESTLFDVVLDWEDRSSNESGFRLYRREFSDPYVLLAETGPEETTYHDAAVEMGIFYSYYVVAFNEAGESAPSEIVEVEFTGA
jgi:hypothetical protein